MSTVEITLKVDLDGEIRRLPLHGFTSEVGPAEQADMLAAVLDTVRKGFSLGESDTPVMRYLDDEGDLCTLVEDTLADALKLAAGGPLKLQASMQSKGPRQTQQGNASARTSGKPASTSKGGDGTGRAEKGWGKGEKGRSEKGKGSGGKDKGRYESRKGEGKGADDAGEFQSKVTVGGEELDLGFDFHRKIVGDGARNVRHIREHTGAHVWLKGRGADSRGRDMDEEMHLLISCHDQVSLDQAVKMAQDLVNTVLDEYEAWLEGGDDGSGSYRKGNGKSKGKGKKGKSKGKGKGKDDYSDRYDDDERGAKRARYDDGRRR